MGEITVDVTLENPIDRGVFERGAGEEVDIRRTSIKATVDTGAVMLVLPQNVVSGSDCKSSAPSWFPMRTNARKNTRWPGH